VLLEIHGQMEHTHNEYAVRSDGVENGASLAVELPECARSAGDCAAEFWGTSNPLESVLDG
jgi:hypothetical protein